MSRTPTRARRDSFLLFSPPTVGEDEIAEVVDTLRSTWITTGPKTKRFEEAFAASLGAPGALALNSCTAGLHTALVALGLGAGDEVITTPMTFAASVNVIEHVGARPVLADVEPDTLAIDPARVEAAMTPRTRAILAVHYAGHPVELDALAALADDHGLALLEDAAHALPASYRGRPIGSGANPVAFSFYATKNLTTGEGGMVTTNSEKAASFIRAASLHGLSRAAWTRYAPGGSSQYDVLMAGFKYNMMDLQAAIGLHQLARIGEMHARRVEIWTRYNEGLAALPLQLPLDVPAGDIHARHLYTIAVHASDAGMTRDELQARLRALGIATSVHFRALHLHTFYQDRLGLRRGMFPAAEAVSDTTLSLPLSAAMSDGDVDRVIEAIYEALN